MSMSPTLAHKRSIALFGGAFDPPHLGHVSAVKLLQKSGIFDEVWLVPSGDRKDKSSSAPASARIEMLKLLIEECFQNDSTVKLFTLQAEAKVPSHTIGLLDYLKSHEPDSEFTVVIGHELLKDLPQWVDSERLKQEARFLVITRPGIKAAELPQGYNCKTLDFPLNDGYDLSSTNVRRLLSEKADISTLIPQTVLNYIQKEARSYYRV